MHTIVTFLGLISSMVGIVTAVSATIRYLQSEKRNSKVIIAAIVTILILVISLAIFSYSTPIIANSLPALVPTQSRPTAIPGTATIPATLHTISRTTVTPQASPSPNSTTTPQPSPSPSPTFTPQPSPSPNSSATPQPSPSPDATSQPSPSPTGSVNP